MRFTLNGKGAGEACAEKRKFHDDGRMILGDTRKKFYITRATYTSPLIPGQIYGFRHKALLYERCFEWIGDQVKKIEGRICVMVKRLSDSTFWFCDLFSGQLFQPEQTRVSEFRRDILQCTRTSAAEASGLLI